MPYDKAYRSKRQFSALSKGKKLRSQSFSRKVLSIVRRADPDEIKYVDSYNTIGTPTALAANTFVSILLNGISQGTTESGRIGSKVNSRYCEVTATLYQSLAAVAANVRVLLVWADTGLATPTAADILEQVSVYSAPNANNKSSYKVLRDELVQVNGTTIAAEANIKWHVDLTKLKMKDRAIGQVDYDGSGNTVSSIRNGALFLFFMSDVAILSAMAGAAQRSGMDYYTRFAYSDK